jgi:two-component system response regulator FixJ
MQSATVSNSERPLVAVVEADATRRGSICRCLSALDIAVSDFDSAESYLAARQPARCLITDIALPGMSGLDLLRCLRQRGVMPPMILLGEDCDVPAAVMAIREGASDFIEMPRAELAIVQRVAQLLRGDGGFPAD